MRKLLLGSNLLALLVLFCLFNPFVTQGQNAQWRGPDRDGIFNEAGLLEEWPEAGPEVLFATEGIGKGYSSAVATESSIFITGIKDSLEYLTCLNHTGTMKWQKSYGLAWNKSFPDSRSTPVVEENRVYVHTGLDVITCFNADNGDEVWQVDLHAEYQSSWDMFGVSESVLIVDDKIITTPCGENTTVVALDKMTGELVWKSKSLGAKRSNMSGMVFEHAGKKIFVSGTQTHLLGADASNGDILWTYHYNHLSAKQENSTILTNTPVFKDSCLWLSNGWDTESVMLEVADDGRSVTEKYVDQTFDNQNHGVVLHEGFLYGSNFTGRNSGKWVCMNWKTGEIVWIADFHNKGPIMAANGYLYCLEEKRGNLALVKANPKEFELISSFKVQEGKGPFWARPSIYGGMLFVRHGDVLIAYNIKA